MDRNPWKRWRISAAWVIAVLLVAPVAAEAQLLPNLPTRKRERPPCETEPPFNKVVRHQYYGYFPTCWRTFPEGWGCPCPNPAKPDLELKRKPADTAAEPPPVPIEPPTTPGNSGKPAGTDLSTPPLPKERDVFDIEDAPKPGVPTNPPGNPPTPLPAPPAAANPGTGPAPTPPSASLPAGADPIGDLVMDGPGARTPSVLLDPGSPSVPAPWSPTYETLPAPVPSVAAPAAPRRGLLSGLFNKLRR